jgi:glycosyltransferase involved in cell wall biosynthesis
LVIPARDEEALIGRALASVARQSCPSDCLEVVVVDNDSQDRTAAVVREFAAQHPGLRVTLVCEPVPGRARAKNTGARAAKGEILVFLDADSALAPDLVERVVEAYRDGYPAGSIRIVSDSDDFLDRAFFGLVEFGKRLFRIKAQMFYCSRATFLALGGFDERLQIAEDLDVLVRLERSGVPLCHLTASWIMTSPRRLRRLPFRLGLLTTFGRWLLAHFGIGRSWPY